jgi:Ca2+-transporting ATPase
MEPGEADIMDRPPRPADESLLDRRTVSSIGGYGLLITIATLTAFLLGRLFHGRPAEGAIDPAITMSFLTIGLAQLFHVFNSRKERGAMRGREWMSNPYVLGALVLTVGLQMAAVYAPGLRTVLHTTAPSARDWLVVAACSLLPLVVGQTLRRVKGNGEREAA